MNRLSKIEIIKETQRMLLNNDYSVMSAKKIGDFMKKNMETNKEWYRKNKDTIEGMMDGAIKKIADKTGSESDIHSALKEEKE